MNKRCSKCGNQKPPEEFFNNRSTKDGLAAWCKVCHSKAASTYAKAHPEQTREYKKRSKDKHPETIIRWQKSDKRRAWSAEYYQNHRDEIKERSSANGKQIHQRLRNYKKNARIRGLSWDLSDEQALKLMSESCQYCGGDGYGIDRIDSSLGYTVENTVSCCSMCNYMKRTADVVDFISHALKISNHVPELVR